MALRCKGGSHEIDEVLNYPRDQYTALLPLMADLSRVRGWGWTCWD